MVTLAFTRELIGQEVTIVYSSNGNEVGIQGIIVDETKSTLKIKSGERIRMVLKKNVTLQLSNGEKIQGAALLKRPEDRVKGNKAN